MMKSPPQPQELMALSRDFMACRVLLSAAELDIFSLLAEPTSSGKLAKNQGWHERPLRVFLDALAAMGLLTKQNGHYATRPEVLPFLASDSPRTVLPMIRHAATIWNTWSNLTRIVTETGGVKKTPGSFENPEDQKAFIGAMHVAGQSRAAAILQAVNPGPARRLLDVGGASGTYTIAFLRASPEMTATLFDLPHVIDLAKARIAEAGLTDRVRLTAGDFYTDALPADHDLAWVSAIIHMNSPEQNMALFAKVYDALAPGGRIIIRDYVMNPDHTAPESGALFAINMLVGTPGGGTYTYEEIQSALAGAGFGDIRLIQNDDQMMGLVEGYKLKG